MSSTVGKFLGNTVGEAAAFAAGVAIAPALHPIVQSLTNEAWDADPTKPLDAGMLAEAVAHGHLDPATGEREAALTGVSAKRFDAMVAYARTGPGVASAFELWRRDRISDGQFDGALELAGIEPAWIELLHDLKVRRLDPPVVALAIVRGIIADPGFLPVGPPATEGKIKAFPTSPINALSEAKAQGFDRDRLFVQTAISGRPMGPESAAAAVFRGILEKVDFDRAISEGDVRNEWAEAIFDTARQIPSASNFVNEHLRGWSSATEMYDRAARHGMSKADVDTLFPISGRPLSWHQIFIGLQRGGVYDGPIDQLDPAFLKGLRESDIRPEWYNLAWAQRYSYPSAFVLRALTQAGDLTQAETDQILRYIGWPPNLAATVSAKWAVGTTATSKGLTASDLAAEYEGLTMTQAQYVKGLMELGYSQEAADGKVSVSDAKRHRLARNQLINRARVRYTGWHITRQAASDALRAAGLGVGLAGNLLTFWDGERELNIHTLTEAQVVKAYKGNIMDKPTAVERLTELGLAPADIDTRLML